MLDDHSRGHLALARAERADLADLLVQLEPAQWNAPSLCTQWRVRDVVAHVFSYDTLRSVALVRRFVAGRLNGDRVNALGVAAYADYSTDELLALVKNHLQPRGLPAGFGGRIALTDGLIHHQDIRRALGIPRDVPTDRLRAALQFAPKAPPIKAAQRIRGLRLTATDVDWTTGIGPPVEGTGEALLMALAGRPAALPELSGRGVQTLAERIATGSDARDLIGWVRVDIRWPGRRGDVSEADVTGDTKCAVRVLSAEVVRCDPGLPFVRRWGMAMVLDGHRLVVADFHGSAIVELSDDASRGTVVGQSREPSFRETLAVAYADDRYLVVNSKAQKRQS